MERVARLFENYISETLGLLEEKLGTTAVIQPENDLKFSTTIVSCGTP